MKKKSILVTVPHLLISKTDKNQTHSVAELSSMAESCQRYMNESVDSRLQDSGENVSTRRTQAVFFIITIIIYFVFLSFLLFTINKSML